MHSGLLRLVLLVGILGHLLSPPWSATCRTSGVMGAELGSVVWRVTDDGERGVCVAPSMIVDRESGDLFANKLKDLRRHASRLYFKVSENDEAEDLDMDEEIEFMSQALVVQLCWKRSVKQPYLLLHRYALRSHLLLRLARGWLCRGWRVAGVVLKRVVDNESC